MTADTEAALAKASAVLAAKRSNPAAPATGPNAAAAAQNVQPPSTPPRSSTFERAESFVKASPLSPMVSKASDLLDEASEKTGVPKQALAAGVVGSVLAAGAALLGAFARGRRS